MKRSTQRRRSPQEIEEILAAYRRSGLSQSAFCEQRGVALSSLTYWLSKARRGKLRRRANGSRASAGQLVPVRLLDELQPQSPPGLEVESARGYLIRVPVGIEPELLARYMHALEAGC